MKESLLKGNFQEFGNHLRLGWEEKVKTADSVSNKIINKIYLESINAGAVSGKLSGAGGGGFMMLYVPTEKEWMLYVVCNNLKERYLNVNFLIPVCNHGLFD